MRNVRNPEIVGKYRSSACVAKKNYREHDLSLQYSDRLVDAATVPRVEQATHGSYRDTVAVTILQLLYQFSISLSYVILHPSVWRRTSKRCS
jgi:hypothetical protein